MNTTDIEIKYNLTCECGHENDMDNVQSIADLLTVGPLICDECGTDLSTEEELIVHGGNAVVLNCEHLSSGQVYNLSNKIIDVMSRESSNIAQDIADYWAQTPDENKTKQEMISWRDNIDKQRHNMAASFRVITRKFDEKVKNK